MFDIRDINWHCNKAQLETELRVTKFYNDMVFGDCLFWGRECSATFQYSDKLDKIIRVEVTVPRDLYKLTKSDTEAIEYKKTFNFLKEMFGEPDQYINIDPQKLKKLEDVYKELSYEHLPRIIWKVDGKLIVHRFKNYWGMIPNTYVSPIHG